ncbi:glycosyltransferase family 2 protein [Kordiimonas aestuarii]|uniref:glycosyltransferase family 2 protein n=1 Tax=Kordiimonas aestuarii TaxID=1005925 RepID=UPI0021D2FE18|nr:glycosyltransferase [Kordiimonas aestuarii]
MPSLSINNPRLSVIVISYNMARELPRTLHSLSAGYQLGIAPSDIEIISIDNGSRDAPAALPPIAELRHLRSNNPRPSPVHAINEGLVMAQGDLVGVWIDGARMASPGVLAGALSAARQYRNPVIVTPNYQLGTAHHAAQKSAAYSSEVEDALLGSINWPDDGYRLFDIATSEMRSPSGPLLESNGIFMRKSTWIRLGGYDEAFDEPGGGYANPDLLRRAVDLPDTELVKLVDEGTFHQCHGGISTSTEEGLISLLKQAGVKYRHLRGKPAGMVRQPGIILKKDKYLPPPS